MYFLFIGTSSIDLMGKFVGKIAVLILVFHSTEIGSDPRVNSSA